MRKTSFLGLLFFFLFLSVNRSHVYAGENDRFSLRLFGGGSYYLLDDIKKGLEGSDALWYLKWHQILEGGFLPFHWGFCLGTEFEFRLKPHFSLGIETGLLQATRERFRKVENSDYPRPVYYKVYDQTLGIAAKAFPLILNGTFRALPLKRLSYFGGFGLGLCLGMMDWQYNSISTDGVTYRETWKGWTVSPILQVRTGIELKFQKRISFVVEAVGRLARLQGLKGRLDNNGTVTEEAVFWFSDGAYHEFFFLPGEQVPDGSEIRKGIVDLSGFSLRVGLSFLL